MVAAFAANPDLPPLNLNKENADLKTALGTQAGIAKAILKNATLSDVQSATQKGAAVFHFAGHGGFTRQMSDAPGVYSGTGLLAFDDQFVEAEQLGINLRGNGIRLAVLAGCETGRRDGVNVWSGVAAALVKAGIPAVVANQFSIRDDCAIAFSQQFYRALVGGLPIERAVTAGRIAAYNADKEGRDWGVPVLYLRAGTASSSPARTIPPCASRPERRRSRCQPPRAGGRGRRRGAGRQGARDAARQAQRDRGRLRHGVWQGGGRHLRSHRRRQRKGGHGHQHRRAGWQRHGRRDRQPRLSASTWANVR